MNLYRSVMYGIKFRYGYGWFGLAYPFGFPLKSDAATIAERLNRRGDCWDVDTFAGPFAEPTPERMALAEETEV